MGQYKPMTERWLDRGHLAGIQWFDGWTWHEVMDWEPSRWRPFVRGLNLLSTEGSGASIQNDVELTDDASKSILTIPVEKAKEFVAHVGIGLFPVGPELRTYVKFEDRVGRNIARSTLNVSSRPTDDYGYVTGDDSPYEDPTNALEFLIPFSYVPTLDFRNMDEVKAHRPTLNIDLRYYQLRHLQPTDPVDARLIAQMANGQKAWSRFRIGSIWSKANYRMEEYWHVTPIPFQQARRLGGGA